jgi:DNA topoisomerase-1
MSSDSEPSPSPALAKTHAVIVESPAKCKKIESFLGPGYKCVASYGHFRELDTSRGLKCVDVEAGYEPQFVLSRGQGRGAKSAVKQMRDAIRDARATGGSVILATDDDREGEAIAWHICCYFGLPVATTPRIVFHEITESAVRRAAESPTVINMDTVQSQLTRQVIDVLVGFTFSPLLWKYISANSKNALSAGRCQIPALRLVWDNDRAIREAPLQTSYHACGDFRLLFSGGEAGGEKQTLTCTLGKVFAGDLCEEEARAFLEAERKHSHRASVRLLGNSTQSPPTPFSTSALQQAASRALSFAPKATMSAAQTLYEKGLITYMRTDTRTYSAEFVTKAGAYIRDTFGAESVRTDGIPTPASAETAAMLDKMSKAAARKRGEKGGGAKKGKGKSKNGKNGKGDDRAQCAHEAIRVTDITRTAPPPRMKLKPHEARLYRFIWTHTVQSLMAPARLKRIQLSVSSCLPDAAWNHVAEAYSFPGFHAARDGFREQAEEMEARFAALLPHAGGQARRVLAGGDGGGGGGDDEAPDELVDLPYDGIRVEGFDVSVEARMRRGVRHLTEAGLVAQLEARGIGRPSTFSSIVDKIQSRGYARVTDLPGEKHRVATMSIRREPGGGVSQVESAEREHVFGAERGCLVIQPIGRTVIEFFTSYEKSGTIFDYPYTSDMETALDTVQAGDAARDEVCARYHEAIRAAVAEVGASPANTREEVMGRDGVTYTFQLARYGPILRPTVGDKRKVFPLRPSATLAFLRRGDWTVEEVTQHKDRVECGVFEGRPMVAKKGRFGWYLEYGDAKVSLKGIVRKTAAPSAVEAVPPSVLHEAITAAVGLGGGGKDGKFAGEAGRLPRGVLRALTDDISIRKGRYGLYAFYKTASMTRPKFLSLKAYKGDPVNDPAPQVMRWIAETHM